MRVRVHPRVHQRHSDVDDDDVIAAFEGTLRSRARDTHPIQWVGVGLDRKVGFWNILRLRMSLMDGLFSMQCW